MNDVMDRLGLGPNGALKYCIETLGANCNWLLQVIFLAEKVNSQKLKIVFTTIELKSGIL